MSRRRDFEIMFGSDSFLDVVANIVGILIILIVIAGVRVSQAPPKPKTPSDVSIPDLESKPAPSIPFVPDIPVEATAEVPEPIMAEVTPEPESDAPVEPLPPLVPPPELVAQVGDLEKEIAAITEESRRIGDSLAKRNQQQTDLDLRLQTARSLLEERQGQLQASAAKAAQGKMDLELTRQALARLLAQVKELESKSPPVEKLQHRITPVSRTVMGRELHFRLEKNRVAEAAARQKLADAEAYRLTALGKVNAEQMATEGALITKHPLLVQKAMADKLSDKVQVIIAPPGSGGFIGNALLAGVQPAPKAEAASGEAAAEKE